VPLEFNSRRAADSQFVSLSLSMFYKLLIPAHITPHVSNIRNGFLFFLLACRNLIVLFSEAELFPLCNLLGPLLGHHLPPALMPCKKQFLLALPPPGTSTHKTTSSHHPYCSRSTLRSSSCLSGHPSTFPKLVTLSPPSSQRDLNLKLSKTLHCIWKLFEKYE
jgi:hypothetical protein